MRKTTQKKQLPEFLAMYTGLPREIYFLVVARIINNLGRFISPLLTLILTQKIGLDPATSGSLITIAIFLQAPCVLLGGKLADSIGRKKVICTFFTLSAFSYTVCGFLPMTIQLAYMLIAAGCLSAVQSSAYDAFVADYTDESNRQASYSLIYMGMNIGASIAPLLAGFLFQRHLRLLFIGDAVTSLVAVTVLALNVKDKYNVAEARNAKDDTAEEMNRNVFSVLFETPELIAFAFIMSLFFFTYRQWDFGLPLCLSRVFSENSSKIYGSLCTINGLMVIFITPFIVALTKRLKITYILALAGLFYACNFLLAPLNQNIFGFIIGIIFLTLGEICVTVNYSTLIANLAKPTHLGRISSIVGIISESGSCLSPMVIGRFIQTQGLTNAMFLVAGIALTGSVLICLLKVNKKENADKNVQYVD